MTIHMNSLLENNERISWSVESFQISWQSYHKLNDTTMLFSLLISFQSAVTKQDILQSFSHWVTAFDNKALSSWFINNVMDLYLVKLIFQENLTGKAPSLGGKLFKSLEIWQTVQGITKKLMPYTHTYSVTKP